MKDMFHLAVTLTLCVPQCSKRVRFMGVLLKSMLWKSHSTSSWCESRSCTEHGLLPCGKITFL